MVTKSYLITHHFFFPLIASFIYHCTIIFTILIPAYATTQPTVRPKSLVITVKKDPSTLQYITHVNQRTPLVSVSLVVDLGGRHLWVDCKKGYISTTYRLTRCHTAQCSRAGGSPVCGLCLGTAYPGCQINTCGAIVHNSVVDNVDTGGEVASDLVSVQSTNGKYSRIPNFIFVCGPGHLLEGLENSVKGMAGLGRTRIALPSQFSAAFSFPRKLSICLPSGKSNGGVLFGDATYVFLTYTPLILNPVSTSILYYQGDASSDYFIGVKSIKINGNTVPVNKTLLSIDNKGFGGTKISTVNPYTVLETSIYKAVTEFFVKELTNVNRSPSVSPFGACFESKNLTYTRVGLSVPHIDLVLHKESVYWRIFGANSMVQVSDDVACLGLVDGGVDPRTSIVIGGHQIEDNLLQFDLATSRLGFSSTLFAKQTTCNNFNFTSDA